MAARKHKHDNKDLTKKYKILTTEEKILEKENYNNKWK